MENVFEGLDQAGEWYPSAVGVLLMNAEGSTVEHNHIHHGWYTGISVGWVWGYGRSISCDNRIEFNHIHDIGQGLLSDMGGIYTLGVSPGTVIRNNLIHDVEANRYGGWGIYHDEGSTHVRVENNVVYNTKFAALNIHYAKEVTFAGGTWADWQKRGKDLHSLYADPLFVDAERLDFRLKPESPAWALGFKPIDTSTVGPRISAGPAAQ